MMMWEMTSVHLSLSTAVENGDLVRHGIPISLASLAHDLFDSRLEDLLALQFWSLRDELRLQDELPLLVLLSDLIREVLRVS